VNKFDLTRLKLTFLEPSELGFTIIIMLIVLIYLLYKSKLSKERWIIAACMLVNVVALYLAKPLGAIVIGAVAVFLMALFYLLVAKPTRTKRVIAAALVLVVGSASLLLFVKGSPLEKVDNSLVQRVLYVAQGKDSSVNYRTGLSYTIAVDTFVAKPLTGQGLGNLSNDSFIQKYYDQGLRTPLVNSYPAFIAEAGIIGLLIVGFIVVRLYYSVFRSKSFYAFGLVTFVVIYQFTGSHFSNPLIWAVYGVVLSLEPLVESKLPIFRKLPILARKKAVHRE
jgi:hypothetical protein